MPMSNLVRTRNRTGNYYYY